MIHDEYERAIALFVGENNNQAAKVTATLINNALLNIYLETKNKSKPTDKKKIQLHENEIARGRTLEDLSLREVSILFEKAGILSAADGGEAERLILRSANLENLVSLTEQCVHLPTDGLRKCLYTQLQFLATLLSFKGWIRDRKKALTQKKFDLDLETGIMTNPTDQSRNISFKAVTFGMMLGQIYSEVVERFYPREETSIVTIAEMQERLDLILFKSGFNAGSNFGYALATELAVEAPNMSVADKIDTWCRFDTSVGWGKFESHVAIDQATSTVRGKVALKSNFLVAEKTRNDFNICSLMSGYIAGVLERLLGVPVQVTHSTENGECAQFNPKKKACDFVITRMQ